MGVGVLSPVRASIVVATYVTRPSKHASPSIVPSYVTSNDDEFPHLLTRVRTSTRSKNLADFRNVHLELAASNICLASHARRRPIVRSNHPSNAASAKCAYAPLNTTP